jgi:hypothetical protein
MIDKLNQVIEIAVHIQQGTRFAVQPELRTAQDLGDFFEGSKAAWQGNKRVRDFGQTSFSFADIPCQFQLDEARMSDFPIHEELGDDPGDGAAKPKGGIRDDTHEAGAAATVDYGVLGLHERGNEHGRGRCVFNSNPVGRAAEHADRFAD